MMMMMMMMMHYYTLVGDDGRLNGRRLRLVGDDGRLNGRRLRLVEYDRVNPDGLTVGWFTNAKDRINTKEVTLCVENDLHMSRQGEPP
jgi:hypothetical protein